MTEQTAYEGLAVVEQKVAREYWRAPELTRLALPAHGQVSEDDDGELNF